MWFVAIFLAILFVALFAMFYGIGLTVMKRF